MHHKLNSFPNFNVMYHKQEEVQPKSCGHDNAMQHYFSWFLAVNNAIPCRIKLKFQENDCCNVKFRSDGISGWLGTEAEPETRTIGTVFPETERGIGTVGTVFQEPKPEPEPSLSVKTVLKQKNPFQRGTLRTENPEPLEPSHTQTETEPNRTGATLGFAKQETICGRWYM